MPKGQFSRPFNKDVKTLSQSKLYGKTGLANRISEAQENKRKMQARIGGELNEKSRYDERKGIWK